MRKIYHRKLHCQGEISVFLGGFIIPSKNKVELLYLSILI